MLTKTSLLAVAILAALTSQGALALDCSREAGSLPDPTRPSGTTNPDIPIEHTIVIMQENHSFDNVLGRLNQPQYYGDEIDGVDELMWNPDKNGRPVSAFHLEKNCVRDLAHGWDASHRQWSGGRNDQFVITSEADHADGSRAMGFYDQRDYPFLYELANQFAVGDRVFGSVLGPTYPNRFYLLAGTSFGWTKNKLPMPFTQYRQRTIFDAMNENGVSWTYYYSDVHALLLFQPTFWDSLQHTKPVSRFRRDLDEGNLAQVVFIESSVLTGDEHPPFDFQIGQRQVALRVKELLQSPYWRKSALFVTYDEHGGFFDHVSPPEACVPDGIPPKLGREDRFEAAFDRLGFRVPFIAVSPWAKRHYVSHRTYDHTSILKFIETKHNLPALTRRDANAEPLSDFFDFSHPDYSVPALPDAVIDWGKTLECLKPGGFRKELR